MEFPTVEGSKNLKQKIKQKRKFLSDFFFKSKYDLIPYGCQQEPVSTMQFSEFRERPVFWYRIYKALFSWLHGVNKSEFIFYIKPLSFFVHNFFLSPPKLYPPIPLPQKHLPQYHTTNNTYQITSKSWQMLILLFLSPPSSRKTSYTTVTDAYPSPASV